MNWRAVAFDWNQVRAFLVTAEEGSLSAAARALGLTQPTIGRQVAALEAALALTLFDRVGKALVLTPSGQELLTHVRAMGAAAMGVSRVASGQSQEVSGPVSVTASDVYSAFVLPPIIERLHHDAPGIALTVIAANDVRDIARREADIAIRHIRPEQPDLIARALPWTEARLYAAPDYLDRIGRPSVPEGLAQADFVGTEDPTRMIAALGEFGVSVRAAQFRSGSDSGLVFWEMVRQGLGIGVMSVEVARLTGGVEAVLPDFPPLRFPTWVTTHRELQTSRRIRMVFDRLAEDLGRPRGL
ncbi:MAG: LysR family transcriptional regulator [Pseudomonadota bacterium]